MGFFKKKDAQSTLVDDSKQKYQPFPTHVETFTITINPNAPQEEKEIDLTHLDDEGQLPWGWFTHDRPFVEKISTEYNYFMRRWLDSRNELPKQQLEALKSFVLYLDDSRKLCKGMGECHFKWFQQSIADDQYILKRKAELKDLEENFDAVCEIAAIKPQLENQLLLVIQMQPGILQTDLCKRYPVELKSEIQDMLYQLSQRGKIRKEKVGNKNAWYQARKD